MGDKNNKDFENPYLIRPNGRGGDPEAFGYVIGNLDPALREALGMPEECASVGIVTSKKRSSTLIFGADESVK